MTQPLVTIGLCAYNAANTVHKAVASALAQTWQPIEIVAVDDCSTDNTRAILNELAQKHPEFRVFGNLQNGGVAVSRNRILAETRGEFVAFFDDDDESLPVRVEAQVKRISDYERDFAKGAPVICHTARHMVYPNGKVHDEPTIGQRTGKLAPAGEAVARRILMGAPLDDAYGACPTCCQMARLSTYQSLGGFDAEFRRSEDTDFNIRLALAGGHFVGLDKALVLQKMTKASEKSLTEEHFFQIKLMQKHHQFMNHEGQFEFYRDWAVLKQAWLEGRHFSFTAQLLALIMHHPLLSLRRLWLALPNTRANRAFSRFHGRNRG